jgi:hypothetical protein
MLLCPFRAERVQWLSNMFCLFSEVAWRRVLADRSAACMPIYDSGTDECGMAESTCNILQKRRHLTVMAMCRPCNPCNSLDAPCYECHAACHDSEGAFKLTCKKERNAASQAVCLVNAGLGV